MEAELLSFLSSEIGDRKKAREIMQRSLEESGIGNLSIASIERRRDLAFLLKQYLPFHSATKNNMILSKMLKVLKVNVDGYKKVVFQVDERHKELIRQKLCIEGFWQDVDKSLTKFEIIFNMFWLRAGEAEIRGMSHDDVMDVTRKSMNSVKAELKKSYEGLKKKFDIEESNLEGKSVDYMSFRGDEKKWLGVQPKVLGDEKAELKDMIDQFWNVIEKSYAKFEKVFFDSLTRDVEIKKNGKDDAQFVDEVRKRLSDIWHDITQGYENLQNRLEVFHNMILAEDNRKKQNSDKA